jgi:hypothetical protein
MLIAYWHMFTTGDRDLGGDYFARRDPVQERATRRLVKQLERLGHQVTLNATA